MRQMFLAYGEAIVVIAAISLVSLGFYWLGILPRPTKVDLAFCIAVYALISVYKIKRGVKP